MEITTNMEKLFEKLGDLKTFFVYGQKLIPTLQKILDFMQDTVPLLENVNKSISDSTLKIPKAAHQLDSVTNATELATTEILDIVDYISNELNTVFGKANEVKQRLQKQRAISEKIKSKYPNDEDIDELLKGNLHEDELDFLNSVLQKIQDGLMNITISLQVQDITSQQLASVNHLINSIQEKLAGLLMDLNGKEKDMDVEIIPQKDSQTFNAEARYEKNADTQKLADSLVAQTNSMKSQKEIDELFSNIK